MTALVDRAPRKRAMSIIDAMGDAKVFATLLKEGPNWQAWQSFLAALFGLTLTADQLQIFRECTQRQAPLAGGYKEAWLCCGRRALKSFTLSLIAVFLACFRDWRPFLGPGELGTIMIIAADKRQARVIMRYVKGLLSGCPMLKGTIVGETAESITLKNRIIIEVHTASFRSTRGYSLIACLCDEIAYWSSSEDSAEPDVEVLAALRPAMSTVPGSMLLCASSPYARLGALWDAHRKHFGKDTDVLVWQATSRYMNPSVPEVEVARALEEDPARANADYNAIFRSDRESIITREAVLACIEPGTLERPPSRGHVAFVDPSGGSSDSMSIAICHREGDRAILDCIREYQPPFSPDAVCAEMAQLCRSYGCTRVTGDNYAKEWPRERFTVHGTRYDPCDKVKTVLYTEFLAILNSRRCELLDHSRLITQLVGLERHMGPSGREQITHAPHAHDDVANAVAGAVVLAVGKHRWWEDANLQRALGVGQPAQSGVPAISATLYATDPYYRLSFFR
jgi:hypothetical protein